MSDQSRMIAFGPCYVCRRSFTFDPDLVPSVPIDPATNLPADLGGEPDRAVKQPLCRECVARANRGRADAGQPLIDVLPGAYGPGES